MAENTKQIIEKVNAAFAKGDTEEFLTFCAEDVEWTMVGNKSVKGKEAIRNWLATMDSGPPKFTVSALFAEGDFGMARGDMMMKEKDGKMVPYSYCDVYRFRNGKIIELMSYVIKTEATKGKAAGSK